MANRWMRWTPLLLLSLLLAACGQQSQGPTSRPEGPGPEREARVRQERERQDQLQRQRDVERCQRERPGLESQMQALRLAEAALARVKQETYRSLPPPEPWDEARESRYRPEDREADWQRHLKAQEHWRLQEGQQRSAWTADHQARLQQAQANLDREARDLRSRRPDLFTGAGSIEFNPVVAEQIRSCRTIRMGT